MVGGGRLLGSMRLKILTSAFILNHVGACSCELEILHVNGSFANFSFPFAFFSGAPVIRSDGWSIHHMIFLRGTQLCTMYMYIGIIYWAVRS